jgi:hypothetical protein
LYATQTIPPLDAKIKKKVHLGTETSYRRATIIHGAIEEGVQEKWTTSKSDSETILTKLPPN